MRTFLQDLDGAAAEDHDDAGCVAAKFGLLRLDNLLLMLFPRILADENIAGDVGRAPSLEIDCAPAVIERVERRRFEHAMIERIADDVDHVMHVADIVRSHPAGDQVSEHSGACRAGDRRQADRPNREAQRIKDGDHALVGHACKFERDGDADRHRQTDVSDRRYGAEKGRPEQAPAHRSRRQIVKERGQDDRHAQRHLNGERAHQHALGKVPIEVARHRYRPIRAQARCEKSRHALSKARLPGRLTAPAQCAK